MAAQRAPPVQIPKRSSGETVQPKTQLGTDNRDSESIFGKLGEKSGLKAHDTRSVSWLPTEIPTKAADLSDKSAPPALCVDRLVAFQPGKRLDGFSGLLLGEAQVVEALEIEPKLRARAKEMSEAQSGVARNSARPIQDLRDAIGRHVDLSRQFSRAHIECF